MAATSLLHRLLQPTSSSSPLPLNHHRFASLLRVSSCSTNRYFTSKSDEESIVNGTRDGKFEVADEEKGGVKSGVLNLSAKERSELTSYAYRLGAKLKTQLVGKSGVSDSAVLVLMDTLEANELVKVKLQKTCPGEFSEVVKHLQEATGSMAINQIGRTMILYKPSLTKLKADILKEATFPGERVKEEQTTHGVASSSES